MTILQKLVVAAVFGALPLVSSPSFAQSTSEHSLTVARWSNRRGSVAFSNAQADSALVAASTVLLFDTDGTASGDVACNVTFSRSGSVTTFDQSDGNLSTNAELISVFAVPAFVKVVASITRCGGNAGSFAGCTPTGALNAMAVTRADSVAGARGQLWAHEFGHSVGLGDNNTAANVMFNTNSAAATGVTSAQCTSFRSNNVDHNGPGARVASLSVQASDEDAPFDPFEGMIDLSIEDLARSSITNHMPIEAADIYSPSDVATLRAMLDDSTESEHYATIASLIGIISYGDDLDSEALITLANREDQDPAATAAAYIALGYLAHEGSAPALEFLDDSARWADTARADWAVQGLGVSGDPDALSTLLELTDEVARQGVDGGSFGPSRDQLDQALADHEVVSALGLRGYYGL